jgi:hypothetical protein
VWNRTTKPNTPGGRSEQIQCTSDIGIDVRHGVVGLRGKGLQYATIRKLRQPRLDGIVEPQLAPLDQNHRRHGSNRLGDRSDAKDRVALHGGRMAEPHRTERLHMHVVMTADERNEAGHLLTFDVPGQHLMHSLEP